VQRSAPSALPLYCRDPLNYASRHPRPAAYSSTLASSWKSRLMLSPLCVRRMLSAMTALTSMISSLPFESRAFSRFGIVLVTCAHLSALQ